MIVVCSKSNVVHFRPQSVLRTVFNCTCGTDTLDIVDNYTYLGIVMNERLYYIVIVRNCSSECSRALGLLIAKCKITVGLPYDAYTKLYDAVVWPVISYGASIWGVKTCSCINAVHNQLMRFFLGVGKFAPNSKISFFFCTFKYLDWL